MVTVAVVVRVVVTNGAMGTIVVAIVVRVIIAIVLLVILRDHIGRAVAVQPTRDPGQHGAIAMRITIHLTKYEPVFDPAKPVGGRTAWGATAAWREHGTARSTGQARFASRRQAVCRAKGQALNELAARVGLDAFVLHRVNFRVARRVKVRKLT